MITIRTSRILHISILFVIGGGVGIFVTVGAMTIPIVRYLERFCGAFTNQEAHPVSYKKNIPFSTSFHLQGEDLDGRV